MAFRKKMAKALVYKPDILIVPECEAPEKIEWKEQAVHPVDMVWIGKDKNKGLAVYLFLEGILQVHEVYNEEYEYVLPLKIDRGGMYFNVLAVWAKDDYVHDRSYIEQVFYACCEYSSLLNGEAIVAGDFNGNLVWDYKRKKANFNETTKLLEKSSLKSTYHEYHGEQFGEETQYTFFMYRKKERRYHIDYCFAGSSWMGGLEKVEVGNADDWMDASDHVPLIVDFKPPSII